MEAGTQSTDLYIKVLGWLHARRKPLLIGGIAVAVVGLTWAVISWKHAQDEADANAQFFSIPIQSQALSVPAPSGALLEVAKEYASTPAGEHAQALAAKDLFTQGKYPEAYQQFLKFIDTYPESALIPQARMGVAACLEAEGKTSDAIQKYREIITTYPTEMSVVSPAKLTLARLFEDLNQPQQALTYYVELARTLTQNPYDLWAAEARERAALLVSKHPELLQMLTNSSPAGLSMGQMGQRPATMAAPKTSTNAPAKP